MAIVHDIAEGEKFLFNFLLLFLLFYWKMLCYCETS